MSVKRGGMRRSTSVWHEWRSAEGPGAYERGGGMVEELREVVIEGRRALGTALSNIPETAPPE